MPNPIFALGIPIPNGNMEYKSDGLGQAAGQPDGYRQSTQFGTDVFNNIVKTYWLGQRRGQLILPYAHVHASRGKTFALGILNTASISAGRYIETPASPAGYTWGSGAVNALGVTGDNWWLRVRCWFIGLGQFPHSAAAWRINVVGYADAAESSSSQLASIALDPVADWNTSSWRQKASIPFQVTTNVHHIRVRLVADRGSASAGWTYAGITDITVETVGPLDAAMSGGSETTVAGHSLAAEVPGGTYYQLTKAFKAGGYKVEPIRFGKARRMPSGGLRRFDPSGGALRRRFTLPLDLVTRTDYVKLYLLWLVNKGMPQELAADQGMPFPILFSPQMPDAMGFYYVDFENEEFPLKEIGSQGWSAATEAGQLYRGTLVLTEV